MAGHGIEVLEVYPYAVKVSLWGKPLPKKTTPEGMAFLQERLGEIIPGVTSYPGKLTHDASSTTRDRRCQRGSCKCGVEAP